MASLLVVDDDPDLLVLLSAHYGNRGHAVATAATCEEALRLAAARRPDALLVDFCLPRTDGARLLELLRADGSVRGVPAIVMSAASAAWVRPRLPSGDLRFVEKPFDFAVLDAALDDVLAAR